MQKKSVIFARSGRREMDRLLQSGEQPVAGAERGDRRDVRSSGPRDVLVSAAGSHPGDLHKLWRTRTPNGYHMEYGYSCMGYEIPGAMGAKMADPSREVYVFLGDGTYQMMPHGNRDVRAGRNKDHHRAGGQSRICQHRRLELNRSAARDFGTRYRERSNADRPTGRQKPGGGLRRERA